jgi:hypothetical protein
MEMKYDAMFVEGVNIIAKYIPKSKDFNIQAEHDQIWFGSYIWVKGEDRKRLKELGWFEDEDSWSMFT